MWWIVPVVCGFLGLAAIGLVSLQTDSFVMLHFSPTTKATKKPNEINKVFNKLTDECNINVILETHFHGHDKDPIIITHEMTQKTYYDPHEGDKKHASNNNFPGLPEVLPGVRQSRKRDKYYPTEHCMNQTFCEEDPNYPQDRANQMLANHPDLLKYSFKDKIARKMRYIKEQPLCPSMEQLIRPKMALSQKYEWLYILQSDDQDFHQTINVEVCKDIGGKCRTNDVGYNTECKQKYATHVLISISKYGKAKTESFQLPAGCCCHVQPK